MSDVVIRLDKSKPFSECRGDRTPDDPHYRVHFWQGTKVNNANVLLPFDANGELVADDGVKEPVQIAVDGKSVTFSPLYNKAMRELVERKKARTMQAGAAVANAEEQDAAEHVAADKDLDNAVDPVDDVNFVSWLKGEARYMPTVLRAAAKVRYHINHTQISELVRDLVYDQKLVPEGEVCKALAVNLDNRAA